jgi:hypothetical protein
MTEELPDAAANEAWLREHERLLADFRELADMPCKTGKQKHPSKAAARAQVNSLRANRNDPTRTSCFRCDFCGQWHIGRR